MLKVWILYFSIFTICRKGSLSFLFISYTFCFVLLQETKVCRHLPYIDPCCVKTRFASSPVAAIQLIWLDSRNGHSPGPARRPKKQLRKTAASGRFYAIRPGPVAGNG